MSTEGKYMTKGGFYVKAGELKAAVDRFKYVVPEKAENEILERLLLRHVKSRLDLEWCDGEMYASYILDVEHIDGVFESVSMAVQYKQLMDFLKGLPDDTTLKCMGAQNERGIPFMLVESDHWSHVFHGIDSIHYPKGYREYAKNVLLMGIEDFRDMIASTAFAADDPTLGILHSIYFHLLPDRTKFVATNGHMLSLYERTDLVAIKAGGVVVPVTALQAFMHGIKGLPHGKNVSIYIAEKRIQFSYRGFVLAVPFLEGSYPDYQSVIPTDTPYMATFELGRLRKAVKRLLPSKDRDLARIEFTFEGNKATLLARDDKLKEIATEVMACKYGGKAFKISFHGESLLSILENIGGERIAMRMTNTVRPVIIEPVPQSLHLNMLCLIMPLADPM
jgi:DNA polymerase-3 subunit beta